MFFVAATDSQHSLLALAFAFPILEAKSTKAELFGMVREPGALPVNGAVVDLINTSTNAKLSVTSGMNGTYRFFTLTAGSYQIAVAKAGCATLRRDGSVIRVGDQVRIDLELRVGVVSQSVEVTAAAPLLQSSRGTASSAEYGRSNGGVIMVNQKSGSNSLHGTPFEFSAMSSF